MSVVLIRRGYSCRPSMPYRNYYPPETVKVATLLSEEGMDVLFADEEVACDYLSPNTDEYWLPILDFGKSKIADIGGVISKVVGLYLLPDSAAISVSGKPKIHLEIFCQDDRIFLEGELEIVFSIASRLGK
ncbi:hypothetical protein ACFWFU_20785 [Streptomyces sp. NPDC060235]|uniref:hypothetical protein n=1 Tax=Streptomyces sp. NPDC060235 TaxID=3347080 RepID=UPI00365E1EC4